MNEYVQQQSEGQQQNERAYAAGYSDGENAGYWDELDEIDAIDTVDPLETPERQSYRRGFRDGLRDSTVW